MEALLNKKLLLPVIATFLLTSNAFSATDTASSETQMNSATQRKDIELNVGIKRGLNPGIDAKVSFRGDSDSVSADDFETTSISAGIIKDLKNNRSLALGLTHTILTGGDIENDVSYTNAEGNLRLRMNNEKILLHGGLNLGKWTAGSGLVDLDLGLGAQIGATYEVAKNVDIVAQYAFYNNSGDLDVEGSSSDAEFETTMRILSIGANVRF